MMSERCDWLSQVQEEIEEPDRRIVDTHFHLWKGQPQFGRYMLDDLWADTGSGHRVEQMVFLECNSDFLDEVPEHLRPIGETRFVAAAAAEAASAPADKTRIGAIVGTADMRLGAAVEEVLQAQLEAGGELFKGIRFGACWDASDELTNSWPGQPENLYGDTTFREAFGRLAPFGLSFDAFNYHPQLPDLADLARAFPDTAIVSNHLGGMLGIGPYRDRRDEIFEVWKGHIKTLSDCPNVIMKLGGLAQGINGFDWEEQAVPPTSDDFAETYRRYYLHAIELFGPERCMFESNFPVDKASVSYQVLWNAFKKMAAPFSSAEKEEMFRGTATRVYRL